jgi:hypothetical protein
MTAILLSLLGSEGRISPDANVSGVSASGQVGPVSLRGSATLSVSGVSANALVQPVIIAGVLTNVTGVSASGSIGLVAIATQEGISFQISGVQGTGQLGSAIVVQNASVTLTGVQGTGQVNSVAYRGSVAASVSGVSANASVGSVNIGIVSNIATTATGVSASASVGSVQASGGETELPDGAILFFDRPSTDTAIPSGFSLYTEYQGNSIVNFLIKGGSANARTTGSPAPVSINSTNPVTSSTDGDHYFPATPVTLLGPGPQSPFGTFRSRFYSPAGGHAHDVTLTGSATYPSSADFQGMQAPLIKSVGPNAQVPAGCIVFSGTASGFTGCTRKTWGVGYGLYTVSSSVNSNKPSPSNVSPSFGLTTATAGAHTHFSSQDSGQSAPGPSLNTTSTLISSGGHVHPGGSFGHVGAWKQFKHLLPFVADVQTPVESGMIVMYEGSSVPLGWNLCDGTNGTPDMVDKFIGYDNTLSTSDALVGRDVIGSTGPTATTPAPPPSAYGSTSIPVTVTSFPWAHSHLPANPGFDSIGRPRLSNQNHSLSNVPHGHTVPNATVTMPNAYTPQHLTLIFIQKI